MTLSGQQGAGHKAPEQYRATGDVTATRKYCRDRLGRFAANPTARAMKHVIAQWIAAGIDRDSDDEVLAVTGG